MKDLYDELQQYTERDPWSELEEDFIPFDDEEEEELDLSGFDEEE